MNTITAIAIKFLINALLQYYNILECVELIGNTGSTITTKRIVAIILAQRREPPIIKDN